MKVHFRVDASETLGAGHLVRCLVLADAIAARGGRCAFFLCRVNKYAERLLHNTIHAVFSLDLDEASAPETDAGAVLQKIHQTADWLVVDHYGLDARWERIARLKAKRILVLDDLADRPHDCDLLVDPGLGRQVNCYTGLMAGQTEMLLGTRYAILKPAYAEYHNTAPMWPSTGQIHVFFGGGSPAKWLPAYVSAMLEAEPSLRVSAVGLGDEQAMAQLTELHGPRLTWRRHVDDMAAGYSQCDLAIGSPGTATWERACVGLPSGLVATAGNQVPILLSLERQGFCRYLGAAWEFDVQVFMRRFMDFLQDKVSLAATRSLGLASVDGLGAQRIVQRLFSEGTNDG